MTQAFPPGPKGMVPGGLLFTFRRDSLGFLMRVARDFGDVAHFRIGAQHFFLVNRPDYIKDILVTHNGNFKKGRGLERAKQMLGNGLLTSEGEFHHRQRRLAQPAFHRDHISRYCALMVEYAERLQRERWRDGQTLDIATEMMYLTLAIVGKTLFDTETEAEAEQVRQAVSASMEPFNRFMLPFSNFLDRLPLPANRRFEQARNHLDTIIYRVIEERRRNGGGKEDLLSMLLAAQDDERDGGQMNDLQLRDEAITIFLAGHETTANALTWTWYLLSEHPEVESRLHEELDRVTSGPLPTVADFPRLHYAEMIVMEAMRLYPPAWILGRRALHDYPLGSYIAPAGSILIMSPYVMHHDSRFFPDPLQFDPERWTPEARAARPQFSYFPFGGGPRRCIGEGFALMEAIMVLATLARTWRLRHVSGHEVALLPLITLRPKHGMLMTVSHRGK